MFKYCLIVSGRYVVETISIFFYFIYLPYYLIKIWSVVIWNGLGELTRCLGHSNTRCWGSIVVLLISNGAVYADQKRPDDQFIWNEPPPGFEDLSEPQSAVVDVYFQHRLVASTLATFAPGWLKIETASEVVQKLPKVSERNRVIEALSGQLATNSALICRDPPQRKCGRLDPGVAEIIFSRDRFRVDLFINPVLLPESETKTAQYLPRPDAGLSALQSIAAAYSGGSSAESLYNVRSFSLIGMDEQRLRADSTASNENGFGVDVLSAEMDQPDRLYRGGLFRSAIVPILGDRPFYGVSLTSSYNTRLDLDQIRGSEMQVFLSRPAKVDILRDGRLLSSQSYGGGNQVLNTSTLPSGSYEVTLRILEAGGSSREERRFFTKTALVPPSEAPRYVLDIGLLGGNDLNPFPDVDNDPVLHGGTTHRLTEKFALGVDVAVTPENFTLQADAFYINELSTVSVGSFGASDGNWGAVFSAYGNLQNISYGLSARRIVAEQKPGQDQISVTNISTGSFTQIDFSSGYSFADGPRLTIGGFWRDDDITGSVYSIGPNILWPLYHGGSTRLDFIGNAAISGEETQVMARMRLFFDDRRYQLNADVGYQQTLGGQNDSESGVLARLDGQWRTNEFLDGELRVGGGVEVDPAGNIARASSRYTGPRGQVSSFVSQDLSDGDDTRFGGELFASILGNGGELTLGGSNLFPSGIIVAIDGDTKARFQVLVNGQPKGEVSTGDTLPLLLPEYKSYKVRLRPIGAPSVYFDSKTRIFSLYPGTVKTMHWQVDPLVTIIGRIVDANKNPIADARLDGGVETAYTDGNGYFQADVSSRTQLSVTRSDNRECIVTLAPVSRQQEYVSVGNLLCR